MGTHITTIDTRRLEAHQTTDRMEWESWSSTVAWSREKRLTIRPDGVVSNQRRVERVTDPSIRS